MPKDIHVFSTVDPEGFPLPLSIFLMVEMAIPRRHVSEVLLGNLPRPYAAISLLLEFSYQIVYYIVLFIKNYKFPEIFSWLFAIEYCFFS